MWSRFKMIIDNNTGKIICQTKNWLCGSLTRLLCVSLRFAVFVPNCMVSLADEWNCWKFPGFTPWNFSWIAEYVQSWKGSLFFFRAVMSLRCFVRGLVANVEASFIRARAAVIIWLSLLAYAIFICWFALPIVVCDSLLCRDGECSSRHNAAGHGQEPVSWRLLMENISCIAIAR